MGGCEMKQLIHYLRLSKLFAIIISNYYRMLLNELTFLYNILRTHYCSFIYQVLIRTVLLSDTYNLSFFISCRYMARYDNPLTRN